MFHYLHLCGKCDVFSFIFVGQEDTIACIRVAFPTIWITEYKQKLHFRHRKKDKHAMVVFNQTHPYTSLYTFEPKGSYMIFIKP